MGTSNRQVEHPGFTDNQLLQPGFSVIVSFTRYSSRLIQHHQHNILPPTLSPLYPKYPSTSPLPPTKHLRSHPSLQITTPQTPFRHPCNSPDLPTQTSRTHFVSGYFLTGDGCGERVTCDVSRPGKRRSKKVGAGLLGCRWLISPTECPFFP